MNRDEALKMKRLDFKWVINKIYDDFESRACENCKHKEDIYCQNQTVDEMMDEFQEMTNYIRVNNSFSCNKWEKLDD